MKQLKHYILAGIIFVLAAGSLSHFLYEWTGNNPIIGFFVPVNESIWEHMKLLFFPMLVYSLLMVLKFRPDYPCITSSLCFGILAGTALIPIFFYAYTYILKKDLFFLDISTFILSTVIAFMIVRKLTLSCTRKPFAILPYGFIFLLFLCFILFTYSPPDFNIFVDPTV